MAAGVNEQGAGKAGSQRQTQAYVNDHAAELNTVLTDAFPELAGRSIEWRSPLVKGGYREYWDRAFLDALGLGEHAGALTDFWPTGGPHWDALAAGSGRA